MRGTGTAGCGWERGLARARGDGEDVDRLSGGRPLTVPGFPVLSSLRDEARVPLPPLTACLSGPGRRDNPDSSPGTSSDWPHLQAPPQARGPFL